ncbi:MAG: biopolymer transporter ExbD [Cyclobacteriaceae bacterium]
MKFNPIKSEPQVSTGSMADIAFLLLIFFLVATTLQRDRGLMLQLPPDAPPTETPVNERNLFKIRINSHNQFLVEEAVVHDLSGTTEEIQRFVLNPNNDSRYAESPQKAIVSIKAQRGTKYASFIATLDQVKEAYYQMYGDRVGLSSEEFRKLDLDDPRQNKLYIRARMGLPMNISIAEPDKIN